jgi:hypothetical protein
LLGTSSILKIHDKIDGTPDIGKKKSMIIELNGILHTELILSINFKTSSGKVAFNITRGLKIIQILIVPSPRRESKIIMNLILRLQL